MVGTLVAQAVAFALAVGACAASAGAAVASGGWAAAVIALLLTFAFVLFLVSTLDKVGECLDGLDP